MSTCVIKDNIPSFLSLLKMLKTTTLCIPYVEYDTPIQSAYIHGYYEEMISFIRGMFSAALTFSVHDTSKDPEAFYHGFMVGATANLFYNKNYEIKSNQIEKAAMDDMIT